MCCLFSCGSPAQLWQSCTVVAVLHSCGSPAQLWQSCTVVAVLHSCGSPVLCIQSCLCWSYECDYWCIGSGAFQSFTYRGTSTSSTRLYCCDNTVAYSVSRPLYLPARDCGPLQYDFILNGTTHLSTPSTYCELANFSDGEILAILAKGVFLLKFSHANRKLHESSVSSLPT